MKMEKARKIFLGFLLFFSQIIPGVCEDNPRNELTPTAQMHTETLCMMRCLSGIHYERRPISSLSMGEILTTYLQDLDPQHLFFLAHDVNEIQSRYGLTLDIFLNSGSVKPAFVIYETFKNRVIDRVAKIQEFLSGDIALDSEKNYRPDREKSPWIETVEEMDEVWESRLTYELLNEILLSEDSAVEVGGENFDEVNGDVAASMMDDRGEKAAMSEAEKLDLARANLRKRYQKMQDSVSDIEPYLVQELFLNSVAKMYDPHSSFLAADSFEDFQVSLTNSLVGIGAILADDNGYCKVIEVYPGSPAEASKQIHPGDRIIAVQQDNDPEPTDIIGMRLNRAVKLIRGEKGSAVRLHIQPADGDPSERKVVTLVRDEIQLTAQRARGKIFHMPMPEGASRDLGYVKLPAFYGANESDARSDSYHDVKELLLKLKEQGAKGLVLDLRGNSGGLLDEAISLAGLFISEGPIVQVRDGDGKIQIYPILNRDLTYSGPLVVLTSRQSVSASEILAGALQNYGRALIVGDHSTYGKGSVQAILPMNQSFLYIKNGPKLGAARITIQKWYLPNGESIQRRGVLADIPLPSFNDFLPIGESDYEHALQWDQIASVPIDRGDGRIDYVSDELIGSLRRKSEDRRQSDEWEFLGHRVEKFGEKMKQNEFSLNLEVRKNQLSADREYRKTLKNDLNQLLQGNIPFEEILIDAAGNMAKDNPDHANDGTKRQDALPEFDIPLREALRILSDWIDTKTAGQSD